ncbi:hypothetical protein JCM14244_17090 [Venenivibrio stagnispumantis]|uniref:Uncharacterized protein n=1 Tax=Venenivibrio stagnispumantis TaxID=407998 RepID=A0AA46AFW5_9AQUI|nr:hypothetical protein [Venenivibrio stagnispumantis]MCW4573970.1 hypothetical protein [Venenivibrio stagnispumantis]SMP22500.1 hypothetical protein SAMN06264868_1266 [Venenivibrio stagnispumantis]
MILKFTLSIILAPVIFAFGGKIYCSLINPEPCKPKQVQEENKDKKENMDKKENENKN